MWKIESTAPELDGRAWAVASSCALADVLICLLVGTGEHCYCPRHFFVGMLDDTICMLVTSSTMETSRMGESHSLEISTVLGLLYIPQHLPTVMRHSYLLPTTLPIHSTLFTNLSQSLSTTATRINGYFLLFPNPSYSI